MPVETHPDKPVLIVNPTSGGGTASRYDLVGQCHARGIEPVVFEPGDDLPALARAAIERGADVIGMAGGDGSQAAVAAVAAEHDVPYVCVPAGTRNHFAIDIGVDRNDVVGALDAFIDGAERRIDLARVNGRFFVNIASMGLYGAIVQSPAYRDAKLRTVIEMLPDLVGPGSEVFDLRFTLPDGSQWSNARLLLVSNNRYELDPRPMTGARKGIDRGLLSVVVMGVGQPFPRMREWTTPTFRIDSSAVVDVALDGEAAAIDPPLLFESVPSALRIRTPIHRHRGPRAAKSTRPTRPAPAPDQSRRDDDI
ncbi:MAG TPA: diacylglycerol kinase family protein [Ilumatobacter sp.]